MRIVTWNCCRGPLKTKLDALYTLSPDVAIITESPKPDDESRNTLWFPSGVSKLGIQVRSSGPYDLEKLPSAGLPNCVVPVRVHGPQSFNLLAVWTWPAPTYIKAFMNGLDAYSGLLSSGEIVVAGDFNGNPKFDKPRTHVKWATAFSRLHEADLVSSYHAFNNADYGNEPHATHHFLRKPERDFHIDYCFIPKKWTKEKFRTEVLSNGIWSKLSDHFPILTATEA